MQLIEVNNNKTLKKWYQVERMIYRNNKVWIPHLKQDIEKIFDPEKNKLYRGGAAIRWVLIDDSGNLLGKIAAFINPKTVDTTEYRNGGVGFFECVNDQKAANFMFDAAKNWLEKQGIEAMDGPINFGERNNYWGLLVENFTSPPTYGMNYNPPYYRDLFENYGFKTYFEQYVFWRDLKMPAQEIFVRKAERLMQNKEIRIESIRGKSDSKIAKDFLEVYNKAWAGKDGFKEMTYEQSLKIIKSMKPVKDPDITLFVYKNDTPIAFYVNLPELNQIFKYVDGNLNWWGKLIFLYHKLKKTPKTMYGIVFGVVKEYQGKGVEAAMIKYAEDHIVPMGRYEDTILTWVGDFNPKMLKVCENLGAVRFKTYITYRKIFDETKPFFRAPISK